MNVRDFDEDSEDFFIFYNSIDIKRMKKNTFALQGLPGYAAANQITAKGVDHVFGSPREELMY